MIGKIFKKRNLETAKKIFASFMIPIFVLQMCSLNLVLANPAMAAEGDVTVATVEASAATSEVKTETPKEEVVPAVTESIGNAVSTETKEEAPETPKTEEASKVVEVQTPTIEKAKWEVDGKKATITPIELGEPYVAPQNEDVTVTFTKLPGKAGNLTIEEITLTDEQVAELGALSNKAYDITSDMKDGTFKYDLTLPNSGSGDVQIKYAEEKSQLDKAETMSTVEADVKNDKVKATDINHFTIFVVTQTIDASDGSVMTVNASENDKLKASDDNRMESDGAWTTSNYSDGRYIEFRFAPSLPTGAIVNGDVKLKFEYQRDALAILDNNYKARLLINNGSSWAVLASDVKIDSPYQDKTFTITIPSTYVNTVDKINNLKIRFQAVGRSFFSLSGIKTQHDYVALDFDYKLAAPTLIAPISGVYRHTADSNKSDWSDVESISGSSVVYYYQSSRNTNFSSLLYNSVALNSSEIMNPGEPDGRYYWRARACDNLGHCSDWGGPWEINIDNTVPSVPINGTPNNKSIATNNFDFNWDVSVDNLPITYEFQSSLNPAQSNGVLTSELWHSGVLPSNMIHSSGAPDGNWYWQVRAIDAAGNQSAWSSVWKVTVDNIAPTLSSKSTFSGWYNSSQISTFNYSDANGIVSGTPVTCGITTEGANQTCSVTPNVCDKAGNCSTTPATSNGANIDLTKPESIITGGDDNGIVYYNNWNGTVMGTASDNLSGVAGVKVSVQRSSDSKYWDGAVWTDSATEVLNDASGTSTWSYALATALVEDTYTVKSHAMDNAGNQENTYTLTIVFDKTIPTVNLSIKPGSPNGDNGWYNSHPTITLTASDNTQLDKIEYQLDSKTGIWTTYANPVEISDGQHVFYYRSLDLAGNYSEIGVKNVKVDTQNPPTVKSLDAHYDTGENAIKLNWDASNDDIYKVYIYKGTSKDFHVNSGSLLAKNDNKDESTTDKDVAVGEKYYYKFVSLDEAGNKSDTKTVSVSIKGNGEVTVTDLGTAPTPAGAVAGATTTENQNQTQEKQGVTADQGEPNSGIGQVEGAATSNNETGSHHSFWWWILAAIIAFLLGAEYRRRKKKTDLPKID